MITEEDLRAALPQVAGEVKIPGLTASAEVHRDRFGIPHIRAGNRRDAFWLRAS